MLEHLSTVTDDDRVVSLHTRRRFRPAGDRQDLTPPPADLEQYKQSSDPDDFRHRTAVNALAFVFVAGLVIAGVWLADTITAMRKTQDCVLIGKRGCAPVEVPTGAR
jgi:hypothetical protein